MARLLVVPILCAVAATAGCTNSIEPPREPLRPPTSSTPSPVVSVPSASGRGVFFPSWGSKEGQDLPLAGVGGILTERDRCLFIRWDGQDTLPLWEGSYSYIDGLLMDSSGREVARVGDSIEGTGAWYDQGSENREWIEEKLIGQPIPIRCQSDGIHPYALIYDVRRVPTP